MKICGKCLHAQDAHTAFNGLDYMYCSNCNKICAKEEYDFKHIHDNQILLTASVLGASILK